MKVSPFTPKTFPFFNSIGFWQAPPSHLLRYGGGQAFGADRRISVRGLKPILSTVRFFRAGRFAKFRSRFRMLLMALFCSRNCRFIAFLEFGKALRAFATPTSVFEPRGLH